MSRASLFLIPFILSFALAQEGAINSTNIAPGKPLNLAELSAKDTASFDTYAKRRALVQDSISATHREIENAKKRTLSQMPVLEPKDEYEKQAEYDVRKAKWEKELGEKTQRDSKPFVDRLAELEKARKKIEDNQASLYCTIDIKTRPEAAAIYLNKEEIGASPAEYNLALPGYAVLRIQKENYEPWDTTLTLQPAQKLKINVVLREKSIFSKEGEIDIQKILAKDTIAKGYQERIKRVKARIKQVDNEINTILNDFNIAYPPMDPKKPEETAKDFKQRQSAWQSEGVRQMDILRQKHEIYRGRLVRSIEVLEDNIIATESQLITETPLNARITFGAYDVEKEVFEITIEDTANAITPFHFAGKVGVPRDTARAMNRSADGFVANVNYINYPFTSGDSSFNIAMRELSLSRKATPLNAEGGFKSLRKFETMRGYGAWRARADSLLSGSLKPQGLDLDYALKGEKAKDLAKGSGKGLGWRGWTRILAFTATAACGTLAAMKHLKAEEYKDKFNSINKTAPNTNYNGEWDAWNNEKYKDLKDNVDGGNDNRNYRNIYGIGMGVFAVAGTMTFVF
jgi:hypothetical protein